jgi:anti-anti-sigma factor
MIAQGRGWSVSGSGMSEARITRIDPHEKVVLVAITRRALSDALAPALIDEVNTAAAENPGKPLVLDFLKVEFIPSSVLGALVRIAQSTRLDGRRFYLIRVDRRVRGTLSVTRLDKVLEVRETVEDVVRELDAPAP